MKLPLLVWTYLLTKWEKLFSSFGRSGSKEPDFTGLVGISPDNTLKTLIIESGNSKLLMGGRHTYSK